MYLCMYGMVVVGWQWCRGIGNEKRTMEVSRDTLVVMLASNVEPRARNFSFLSLVSLDSLDSRYVWLVGCCVRELEAFGVLDWLLTLRASRQLFGGAFNVYYIVLCCFHAFYVLVELPTWFCSIRALDVPGILYLKSPR